MEKRKNRRHQATREALIDNVRADLARSFHLLNSLAFPAAAYAVAGALETLDDEHGAAGDPRWYVGACDTCNT